ncbi:MAG TPA: glycosyltransferase, partial [Bdellovibrio sp.]|nr:glycosyltransferase [Bdellovibrio sp.]
MKTPIKTLVIVPTYNEKENIQNIVPAIFAQNLGVDILVVDDNSPDGTGAIVRDMQKNNSQLHLLSRPGKQGLGKAYIAGFRWGMDQGYD